MTKIGELPVDRSDGTRDVIDLHEPGTFDHDPLLIQTSSGQWGTPYLQPVGEGDTGLVVQASDGSWWQVNRHGILDIETWESGVYNSDRWNWTDEDFTGTATVHDTRALYGQYSLHMSGFRVTAAMPDYPDPAPNLPVEVGETIRYHFLIPHYNDLDVGQQYWFGVLVQSAPHHSTTPVGDQDRGNRYTLEAITGSNDLFRFSKRKDGTTTRYTAEGATVDWEPGVWYRVDVQLRSGGIQAPIYKHAGGDAWDYLGTAAADAPDWQSGGITIRSGGNDGESNWDSIQKVPGEF